MLVSNLGGIELVTSPARPEEERRDKRGEETVPSRPNDEVPANRREDPANERRDQDTERKDRRSRQSDTRPG